MRLRPADRLSLTLRRHPLLAGKVATQRLRRVVAAAALALLCAAMPAAAQAPAETRSAPAFVPESGQAGKDVVWVPTPQTLVDAMLDLAQLTPQDFLMDLGSGDGRTVITAAKRGAHAHGIEYEPRMVELAKANAAKEGVSERATFEKADLFETDFSKAQVVTLFLLPSINEKLRPKLLEMAPGTRVVSNTFRMGDWEPDDRSQPVAGCQSWCTALLWIVPAKVEGAWSLDGKALKLTQRYQMLSGTLDGAAITEAKLRGKEIVFKAGGASYRGTVEGATMTGEATGGAAAAWSARRS